MNRRQLIFLVLINAMVSLVIALGVVLAFEARRPDPEELAAINAPSVQPILATSGEPQISTQNSEAPGTGAPAQNGDDPSAGGESAGENGAGQTGEGGGSNGTDSQTGGENGAPAPVEDEVYVVEAGDSLFTIASRYNVTIDDIVRANDLANPDSIFSGQRLTIPMQGRQAPEQDSAPSTPLGEGVEIVQVDDAGELGSENVLIVNESNLAFSLLGWRLEREGGPTYTFGNIPLFPGSSVRVHTRAGEDSSIELFWGQDDAQWQSNTVARLINDQGIEIYQFTVP